MDMGKAPGLPGRIRAFLFLASVILPALVGGTFKYYKRASANSEFAASHGDKDKHKKKKEAKLEADLGLRAGRAFQGGAFEASGVAYVPGTDGVLFVDDNRADEILWMRLDQEGNQLGNVEPVKMGVIIDDPEGITFDGSWYYVVGSQSQSKEEETASLARFRFDPQSRSVKEVESVGGLHNFLTGTVPELREYSGKKGKKGGINIEGLAWDPVQGRLLLGMRDPIIEEQALVVALKLRAPEARLSRENLTLAQSNAIRLSLGGDGIRSIEYDSGSKLFQIISGGAETKKKANFKVWEWDGRSSPRERTALNSELKPEGIARVYAGGQDFVFIVCDISRYFRLD